jgi:colanic acid biosynthesis glycosyl transferase WcaI
MRAEVDAAAAALPNLRRIDFQPEARFAEFLAVADLHVLPQEREAADLVLPSKLGGMLASGRPIVVTTEPGAELADFLGASCVLTPPGDSAALAAAVARLAAEPAPADSPDGRLARARLLSKDTVIADFTETALAGVLPAPGLQPVRSAGAGSVPA